MGKRVYTPEQIKERRRLAARARYLKNPEKVREQSLKWFRENRTKGLATHKKWRESLKDKVLDHYGRECVCCGEKEKFFLCIDHIDGGGKKERAEHNGGGHHNYRFIIKSGFPEGKYRVLCYNCNCGRERNKGICPHEEKT